MVGESKEILEIWREHFQQVLNQKIEQGQELAEDMQERNKVKMDPLEAKILGEKAQYYCSSSEDSDSEYESASENEPAGQIQKESLQVEPGSTKWEGVSQNTGPKGVVKDMEMFKKLQQERRKELECNRRDLIKQCTLTVQSALDEEKAMLEDPDLADLLDNAFLLEYNQKRMLQLMDMYVPKKTFGKVFYLDNADDFVKAIDDEDKLVIVIIHIYEQHIEACRTMNECLEEISKIYTNTKFCKIRSKNATVSHNFKTKALPALLVYKDGALITSFLQVTEMLGDHFYTEELLEVLLAHGVLVDKKLCPKIIAGLNEASSGD
ncbi:hypothetical protein FQA39_LY01789 [Lamprigera yunnana]|nr:hypothetical protein FQA39_LY01789 [Lamprigera yunnana]